MRRPRVPDLLWVAAGGVLTALLVARDPAAGVPEWVFGTVLFTLAGHVLLATCRAGGGAWRERRRARDLAATEPRAIALAAIREERHRLVEEIGAVLRAAVATIDAEVASLDAADPRPGLRRIHRQTQLATAELRRQLGLLRAEEVRPVGEPLSLGPAGIPRRDLWIALAAGLLAAAEHVGYLLTFGRSDLVPWSALLAALAASCVVGRTAAPGGASVLCAAVLVTASQVGFPVLGGFWAFVTIGGLVWATTSRADHWWREVAGAAVLVAALGWTRAADDPGNLLFAMLIVAVAGTAGLVVRLAHGLETTSAARADLREAELSAAARAAVHAERTGFARELHDVTSHAIGLIAMQAGAGQVSWPRDPDAVRRSVAVIAATTASTLAELDRLGTAAAAGRGVEDLHELVQRIRAAGTTIDLTVVGEASADAAPVVHRIVQEALTNAVRHAPGAAVRVVVTARGDRVEVRVSDDGHGGEQGPGRGYGLVGLAERVALAGGTLRTGRGASGGFVVEASLPVGREAVAP